MDKTLYYPVWISPGRKAGGWSWGAPCDTIPEADKIVKERMAAGATLGCVVKIAGGERTPMAGHVYPDRAKTVIRHWEDLWDLADNSVD